MLTTPRAIENELLERLKQVSEGEIYNYPERQYTKVMSEIGEPEEGNHPSYTSIQTNDRSGG